MRDLIHACIVVALIVGGPFWSIWAVNLLFHLSIPMNFWTWLAALWLGCVL